MFREIVWLHFLAVSGSQQEGSGKDRCQRDKGYFLRLEKKQKEEAKKIADMPCFGCTDAEARSIKKKRGDSLPLQPGRSLKERRETKDRLGWVQGQT